MTPQQFQNARNINPQTGKPYTLIDANRMRRSALDTLARHHHEAILCQEMLAHADYLHTKLMADNNKVQP